ncbi:DUF559 domain-containing protein [uncultured Corynebacterium sp.]|uniref:DUF559 domain-containing protein n=1 Tax=uncultured Corynebacterium sp. TaxID=159447 RepID=UPI0025F3F37F|nr:DUF559 domain-containing protein [uncultured Corynebacterium sp.]
MPTDIPEIRASLRESGTVTDWALRRDFVQAAPGVVVLKPGDYDASAFDGFGLDIVTRVWAQHLIRPDAVIGGWGALGVLGLRMDWADCAPVLLLSGETTSGSLTSSVAVATPRRPVIRPLPTGLETCTPCPRFPALEVVQPAVAAVQCLWTVLTGRHFWWVHDVPDLVREDVMAVQLLDALAQCTWVTRAEIRESAAGTIDRRALERLLELSDDGAQSPMETTMRLIVRDLLPEPYRWQSQVRVDLLPDAAAGWTPKTLPDLGCQELKIALYYDGGHHTEGTQTEVDFNQFHALRDLGWEVIRFNKEHLRDPEAMRVLVTSAIARARESLRVQGWGWRVEKRGRKSPGRVLQVGFRASDHPEVVNRAGAGRGREGGKRRGSTAPGGCG